MNESAPLPRAAVGRSEGVADTSDGDRRALWRCASSEDSGEVGGIELGLGREQKNDTDATQNLCQEKEDGAKVGEGGREEVLFLFWFGDGDWQSNWVSDSSDWAHWECWPRARESGHI